MGGVLGEAGLAMMSALSAYGSGVLAKSDSDFRAVQANARKEEFF